jgi:hypothetical protein
MMALLRVTIMFTIWILEIDTAVYAFWNRENALHLVEDMGWPDYNLNLVNIYDMGMILRKE